MRRAIKRGRRKAKNDDMKMKAKKKPAKRRRGRRKAK
jgi:hypothetical protein